MLKINKALKAYGDFVDKIESIIRNSLKMDKETMNILKGKNYDKRKPQTRSREFYREIAASLGELPEHYHIHLPIGVGRQESAHSLRIALSSETIAKHVAEMFVEEYQAGTYSKDNTIKKANVIEAIRMHENYDPNFEPDYTEYGVIALVYVYMATFSKTWIWIENDIDLNFYFQNQKDQCMAQFYVIIREVAVGMVRALSTPNMPFLRDNQSISRQVINHAIEQHVLYDKKHTDLYKEYHVFAQVCMTITHIVGSWEWIGFNFLDDYRAYIDFQWNSMGHVRNFIVRVSPP